MTNPAVTMLDEVDIHIALLMNYDLDYKKMRKLVLKLMKRAPTYLTLGYLQCLMETKKPQEEIDRALMYHTEMPKIVEELIAEEYVGLVLVNDEVYPVKIWTEEKEDILWTQTHEAEVALALAEQCMINLKRETLKCSVFLFKRYGFTGRPNEFSIATPAGKARNSKKFYGKKRK